MPMITRTGGWSQPCSAEYFKKYTAANTSAIPAIAENSLTPTRFSQSKDGAGGPGGTGGDVRGSEGGRGVAARDPAEAIGDAAAGTGAPGRPGSSAGIRTGTGCPGCAGSGKGADSGGRGGAACGRDGAAAGTGGAVPLTVAAGAATPGPADGRRSSAGAAGTGAAGRRS